MALIDYRQMNQCPIGILRGAGFINGSTMTEVDNVGYNHIIVLEENYYSNPNTCGAANKYWCHRVASAKVYY